MIAELQHGEEHAEGVGALAPRRLEFVRPLVGFAEITGFELRSLGVDYEPYARLVARGGSGLEFIVVPPGALFPDYVFEIPDEIVALLGVEDADSVEVYVLVTGGGASTPTVNLMGPLVRNRANGRGAQLVLQDDRYGVAVPVDAGRAQAAGGVLD